jgi:hypothetical protein
MAEFSQRVEQIEHTKDELIDAFVADHGRRPTGVEILRLRQRATITTRPAKSHRSLAEMSEHWHHRAGSVESDYAEGAWVTSLRNRNDLPLLVAGDLAEPMLADAARAVVSAVAERRATYRRDNILDEAHRLLHGVRFGSPDDRVTVAEQITDLALDASLTLTPPPLHHTPERYLRTDGSSRLAPRSHRIYTTETLLDAEARLFESARRRGGPTFTTSTVARITEKNLPGRNHRLSVDQAVAVEKIATSRRCVDVLVGPAGTGKSTALVGLKAVWEAEHGPGSVIGLAPSAAAAEVLAGELGVSTDNTAKWLTEHRNTQTRIEERRRIAGILAANPHPANSQRLQERLQLLDAEIARWRLQPGQLLIIDEAGLAGTFALDELVRAAGEVGAKILLSGDWAQQGSVDAGGAFGLLARDEHTSVAELGEVHRFISEWERTASIKLRHGDKSALHAYESNGRITGGSREELLEAVYSAWKHDVAAGNSSLMIAPDAATVSELNRRARADRIATAEVAEDGVIAAAGQTVGVGDQIVTRRNDRHLATGTGWVKNGDCWVVTAIANGTMTVRRAAGHGVVVLPADYVAQHVELSYATTAYRSQGRTVGTAHALVSPWTNREALYVAATRGRSANFLYVDTAYDPDPQTGHDRGGGAPTAREVLTAMLANTGAETSVHETVRHAQQDAESWASLHAEYETLAHAAQAERWNALLGHSGLTAQQLEDVRSSDAQGPLVAAFRRAEARGLDIGAALSQLVGARPIVDAHDVASVLHKRVERFTQAAGSRRRGSTNLIAGLVPRALNVTDPDLARALEERDHALQGRAWTLAQEAVTSGASWLGQFGEPPTDSIGQKHWLRAICTVAAYRERWSIGDDHRPLGPDNAPTNAEQITQRALARTALRQAVALGRSLCSQPQRVGAAVKARRNDREMGV